MDWNFDGNEYDPIIPNDYERVVRGKHNFCCKYCLFFSQFVLFNDSFA